MLFEREKKKFGDESVMKWVTALIALSLIFLFSDVIYRAKLEGKIFPSFLKHFSLQVAQQVIMTVVDSATKT